jgi:hypothetical protein
MCVGTIGTTSTVVQYVLPEASPNTLVGCPVASTSAPQCALPSATSLASWIGAQLLAPAPSLQIEADREQEFTVRAPGMSQVMLIPQERNKASQPEMGIKASTRSSGSLLEEEPVAAVELEWDVQKDAFSACVVVHRVAALEIAARKSASDPWLPLLELQVLPESQHLRERPDLVFQPPDPDPKDPKMAMVSPPLCTHALETHLAATRCFMLPRWCRFGIS